MGNAKRRIPLKQRIILCLAAFSLALAAQIFLNYCQSKVVLEQLDDQMGNFNAISRFQGGVEACVSVLEEYRWEYGDENKLIKQVDSAISTTKAWIWRINGDVHSISEEQYVIYSSVNTTYQSYIELINELETCLNAGNTAQASQLYYSKIATCGEYLSQYSRQLLETAIEDGQDVYTNVSEKNRLIKFLQMVDTVLCLVLGFLAAVPMLQMLATVQQMISASEAIGNSRFDTPDIVLPKQAEMARLADSFNHMKRSMAQQVSTLQEKNEIERELHRQKTQALELQNRMEHSRLQQLRSQIDPHFLFNTLNVILQTAGAEKAYRTQALITALSHLLRYSLMSNDEQVPLSREMRIVDEYYSIYHVRFGERIMMRWRISDDIDITETMVPSFILQPIVENAFKHGIGPKEEGGVVRIRISAMRSEKLLRISICDNGNGIKPEKLAELKAAISQQHECYEHIGFYNVAARLRLLDKNSRFVVHSKPGRGTSVTLYMPLVSDTEEEEFDDDSSVDC